MPPPPVMSADGTISLHGRDELDIPLRFTTTEPGEDPVEEDCSAAALFFEVDPSDIRVPLAPDPNNALGRRLQLLEDEVLALKRSGASNLTYVVRDETAHPHFVRLEGRIVIRGFVRD